MGSDYLAYRSSNGQSIFLYLFYYSVHGHRGYRSFSLPIRLSAIHCPFDRLRPAEETSNTLCLIHLYHLKNERAWCPTDVCRMYFHRRCEEVGGY